MQEPDTYQEITKPTNCEMGTTTDAAILGIISCENGLSIKKEAGSEKKKDAEGGNEA